jgi:hypothetical protein
MQATNEEPKLYNPFNPLDSDEEDDFDFYLEFFAPIRDFDEDGKCHHCRWRPEFPESHAREAHRSCRSHVYHAYSNTFWTGNQGCKYIMDNYDVSVDADGEVIIEKKLSSTLKPMSTLKHGAPLLIISKFNKRK